MFWLGRQAEIERARECAERAADEVLHTPEIEEPALVQTPDKLPEGEEGAPAESFGGGHDGGHGDEGGAILKSALHDMHNAKRYNSKLLDVDPAGGAGGGTGAILAEIRGMFSFDSTAYGPKFFDKADQIGSLLLVHYRQYEDLSRGLILRYLIFWALIACLGFLPALGQRIEAWLPAPPAKFEPAKPQASPAKPLPKFVPAGLQGDTRADDQDGPPPDDYCDYAECETTPAPPAPAPAEPRPQDPCEPRCESDWPDQRPADPPKPAEPRTETNPTISVVVLVLYLAILLTPENVQLIQIVLYVLSVLNFLSRNSTLYMACANGFVIVRNRFRTLLMTLFHDLYSLVDKACSNAQSSVVSNRREKQQGAYDSIIEAQYLGRGADLIVQYATHCLKRATQSLQGENMGFFRAPKMRALPGMPVPFWWHLGFGRTAPRGPDNKVFYTPSRLPVIPTGSRSPLRLRHVYMLLFAWIFTFSVEITVQIHAVFTLGGAPFPDITATFCWCQAGYTEVPRYTTTGLNWNVIFQKVIGPIFEQRWSLWVVLFFGTYVVVSARTARRATANNFAIQLLTPRGLPPHLIAQYGLLGEHVDPSGAGRGFSLEPDSHGHYFEAVADLVREIWALVHSQKTHYPDH